LNRSPLGAGAPDLQAAGPPAQQATSDFPVLHREGEIPRGGYAVCLPLHRARRSLLAWRLDRTDVSPEHGGPLRLVAPPTKWAYKGVKWISRLTLVEAFSPGFGEDETGDPHGDIPEEILDHVEGLVRRRLY
jgi:DMSO/TMAO reductase YedYZ molybdopterin-dependent catalytic subunit